MEPPAGPRLQAPVLSKDARLVHPAAISCGAVELPLTEHWEYLAKVRMNMLRSSVNSKVSYVILVDGGDGSFHI